VWPSLVQLTLRPASSCTRLLTSFLCYCVGPQEEREGEIRFAEGNVMSWDDVSRNVQDAIELVGTMSLGSASHVLGTPLVRALSNEQRPQHGPNALPKAAWR
jgi:hypothetical protein